LVLDSDESYEEDVKMNKKAVKKMRNNVKYTTGLSIKTHGEWHNDSDYLMWLLAGEAEIMEDK
jgi:hypothetical protein